jgi:outer membrane murein-binding lipoprotein Lpp
MQPFKLLAVSIAMTVMAGCATTDNGPKPHSWAKAVQTADSRDAHNRLADHYEEIASTLEADAIEEQEMLDEYLARPWKYGKRIQDLKTQASSMVRDLKAAAKESRQMAGYHRQMADEQR